MSEGLDEKELHELNAWLAAPLDPAEAEARRLAEAALQNIAKLGRG